MNEKNLETIETTRGPHTKRNFNYGKELCLLVGGSVRALA